MVRAALQRNNRGMRHQTDSHKRRKSNRPGSYNHKGAKEGCNVVLDAGFVCRGAEQCVVRLHWNCGSAEATGGVSHVPRDNFAGSGLTGGTTSAAQVFCRNERTDKEAANRRRRKERKHHGANDLGSRANHDGNRVPGIPRDQVYDAQDSAGFGAD